ncbi:MAG: putative DNA binding domain-containing protein [Methanomassiliicoccaceae archaeon]|nr:putative DNA binding domain-containing protein [Methanomassiliicoccaceae archaeon]
MESETEEWKESWHNDWLRWIAAFASQEGGKMIIGKDDKGRVVGVRNYEKLLTEIPNTISNKLGIAPSVKAVPVDDKMCIEITVEREGCPIALDGVFYKRSGSTTRVVAGRELRSWLLNSWGMSWTDAPAKNTKVGDLSQEAIDFFVSKGMASRRMSPKAAESGNEALLMEYDMATDEGLLNAGAICFLEEPGMRFWSAQTRIGAFSEDNSLIRHDLIDCAVVMQPDRVMDILLNKYILGTDELDGLMRVTRYPYPEKALREALMNATVHRDYLRNMGTYIKVHPDRISIFNPGALPEGWTKDDLLNEHRSAPANPAIARAFFDMGYIESWGSGIKLMERECKAMGLPAPEYVVDSEGIEVTFRLPEKKGAGIPEKAPSDAPGLTERESRVYALVCDGSVTTIAGIAEATGTSFDTAKRTVNKLVEKGYLQRTGSRKDGRWIPVSRLNG